MRRIVNVLIGLLVVLTTITVVGTPARADASRGVAVTAVATDTVATGIVTTALNYQGGWSLQMLGRPSGSTWKIVPPGWGSWNVGIYDVAYVRVLSGLCMRRQILRSDGTWSGWSAWMHGLITSYVGYRSQTRWAVVSC